MNYRGRYKIFDPQKINTYPLHSRTNKVKLADLVTAQSVTQLEISLPDATAAYIAELAQAIVNMRRDDKPVILFTGAHLIKNGLGPLLIDLVQRDIFTLIAGNGATGIHDFELALIGETSEYVPNALETGGFGMAYEFALINTALAQGNAAELGSAPFVDTRALALEGGQPRGERHRRFVRLDLLVQGVELLQRLR